MLGKWRVILLVKRCQQVTFKIENERAAPVNPFKMETLQNEMCVKHTSRHQVRIVGKQAYWADREIHTHIRNLVGNLQVHNQLYSLSCTYTFRCKRLL